MKKINELKTHQEEEALKRKEEIELKQKEAEENKKRLDEKRKEEQRIQHNKAAMPSSSSSNQLGSAQKIKPLVKPFLAVASTSKAVPFENKTNAKPMSIKPLSNDLCKTPSAKNTKIAPKGTPHTNKKTKNDNYDIGDLKSGDDTDDDEEPSKPIPEWAREPNLSTKAIGQCFKGLNYTKLFRASSQKEIILENIFKIKRKKFTERSSSAIWNSPPVWRTNGLNGDESFRQLHNL